MLLHQAGRQLAESRTDADGRIADLGGELAPGAYRLEFATAEYFGPREHLLDQVGFDFTLAEGAAHHHLPLLLSPFGCSTYRGS